MLFKKFVLVKSDKVARYPKFELLYNYVIKCFTRIIFSAFRQSISASLLVISYICGGGGQPFVVKNFGYRKQNDLIL